MAYSDIKVAIREYTELLSVLIAENKIFFKGQSIWAIDNVTGSMKLGQKKGDFDPVTMAPGAGTPFNALPWVIKPESSGSGGYTPFDVETTSDSFSEVGSDTVIEDTRLLGVTEALVYSTERAAFFRKEDRVINPTLGTITLPGYTGMGAADQLSVFIPAAIVVSATLTALEARIEALEVYARPFAGDGGGKVLWGRPAVTIPAGWREWEEARGKVLIAKDSEEAAYDAVTNPNSFNRTVGDEGGSKTHTIGSVNNLPRFRLMTVVDQSYTHNTHPAAVGRQLSGVRSRIKYSFKTDTIGKESYEDWGSVSDNQEPTLSPTSWVGKESPDEITHLNPFRIVHYIEPDI